MKNKSSIKVGVIGRGRWGSILLKRLNPLVDVVFSYGSRDNYKDKIDKLDWVVVATPNNTHFDIVKTCILEGKNVFCEKPLTVTFEESKELYSLAKLNNVKLYVSDIQNFRPQNFQICQENQIIRTKSSKMSVKDILFNLTYHDIYKLYVYINSNIPSKIRILDKKKKLHFEVYFGKRKFTFMYDTRSKLRSHLINDFKQDGDDDIISDMFTSLFNNKLDFDYNRKVTLYTIKTIEHLKVMLFNDVAVVGGGIFGCTAACLLSSKGYNVTLFEKNKNLMSQASSINQYRLHSGYHYPRSFETAKSSMESNKSFVRYYGDSLVDGVENYYCIASENSLTSSSQYIDFLNQVKLDYSILETDVVKKSAVDLTVKVSEKLFDPEILIGIVKKYIKQSNVTTKLGEHFGRADKSNFDYVINSTYSNINQLVEDDKRNLYQFELCEKPVVKLPIEFKNKSIVIMDGPFMCIDPFGNSDYHVLGNVVHAIHESNVGYFPQIPEKYYEAVNNGIIKNCKFSKINDFIKSSSRFFKNIEYFVHIGSMFTVRTVLPNRDYDDARPTLVRKQDIGNFSLFSGKITTCVDASEELYKKLME